MEQKKKRNMLRYDINSGYSNKLDTIVVRQTASKCLKDGYTCLECPIPNGCRWEKKSRI